MARCPATTSAHAARIDVRMAVVPGHPHLRDDVAEPVHLVTGGDDAEAEVAHDVVLDVAGVLHASPTAPS